MRPALGKQPLMILSALLMVFVGVVAVLYLFLNGFPWGKRHIDVSITSNLPHTKISYLSSPVFEKVLSESAAPGLKKIQVTLTTGPLDTQFPFMQGLPGHQYQLGYTFQLDTIGLTIHFLNPHEDESLINNVIRYFILGLALQQKDQHITQATMWDGPVQNSSHLYFEKFYYRKDVQQIQVVSFTYE